MAKRDEKAPYRQPASNQEAEANGMEVAVAELERGYLPTYLHENDIDWLDGCGEGKKERKPEGRKEGRKKGR